MLPACNCNWVIFCSHSVRGWHFDARFAPHWHSYRACNLILCLMRISEVISVDFSWHLPTWLCQACLQHTEKNQTKLLLLQCYTTLRMTYGIWTFLLSEHISVVFLKASIIFNEMTPAVIFLVSVLEGKRKRTSHSADSSLNSHESSSQFSSSVGSESESDEKHKHHKHKRHVKSKRSKRKRRESKKERNNTPSKQRSFFLSSICSWS